MLLKVKPIRDLLKNYVSKTLRGPNEQKRMADKAHAWACASNREGKSVEAWLQTAEGYTFTALSAVRCVEKTLELHTPGALTPSVAFGADFVLEIPGTVRTTDL